MQTIKHRFQVLDIFRGVFAIFVVLYHMREYTKSVVLQNGFVQNSFLFVDFFFILSGFVIAYNYQNKRFDGDAAWSFIKKRVRRIYPLHLCMLLVFLLYEGVKVFAKHNMVVEINKTYNDVYTFISSLFLLNSVKLPHIRGLSWNNPSWSISAEMLSYLLFAITLFLLYKFKLTKIKIAVYLFFVLLAYFLIVRITNSYYIFNSYDYGYLRGFVGFFLGVICFNCFDALYAKVKDVSGVVFSFIEILLLAAVGYSVYQGAALSPSFGFIYEIIFFLGVLSYSFEKGIVSSLMKKSALLREIGICSFSIYMVHAIINRIVNIVFIRLIKLPPSSYSWLFLVDIAIVILVARWTYKNIEMRFYKPTRGLSTAKTPE